MTDRLRDVLTARANAVDIPSFDLDAIVRTGDRRIRRRRVGGSMLAAAASIALIATGWAVLDQPSHNVPAEAPAFTERRPLYSLGNRIHYGSDVIDLGRNKMVVFVQTDHGFVFTDRDRNVFLADGTQITRIGKDNWSYRLAADDSGGNLASWVEEAGHSASVVIYDTGQHRVVARVPAPVRIAPNNPSPTVTSSTGPLPHRSAPAALAVDGDTVYFNGEGGTRRFTIGSTTSEQIMSDRGAGSLLDVAAGQLAFDVDGPRTVVSANPRASQPQFPDIGKANLSPLATRVYTLDVEVPRFYDVRSGAVIPVRHPEHSFVAVTQWVDENTAVAVGLKDEKSPVDLLSCSLTAGRCQVIVRGVAPPPDNWTTADFHVPTGQDFNDL